MYIFAAKIQEKRLLPEAPVPALLDTIEIKKDLISELNKLKFFKKLLLSYSPSKNLIVKKFWVL